MVRHVVLIQIDGVTTEDLEGWLARPAAHREGRVLHTLLGATPAEGGPVRLTRAQQPRRLLSPLPAHPDTASATLLTGMPPREHQVRGPGQNIAPTAPTLFDIITRNNETSICTGFPDCGTATVVVPGQSDAVRVRGLLEALKAARGLPSLIVARFDGPARALAAGGPAALPEALDRLDQQLHQLAVEGPPIEATVQVLVAGTTGLSQQQPQVLRQADLAALIRRVPQASKLPDASLHFTEGLLRVSDLPRGADRPVAEALAGIKGIRFALLRELEGVSLYDLRLKAPRPLAAGEAEGWPDLVRRVRLFADPGDVVAVVAPEAVLLPAGRKPGRARQGGASAEESRGVLVFAGPAVARAPQGALGAMPLEAVAPTILDLLGFGSLALGPDVAEQSVASRLTPRPITPRSTRWAACREAADGTRRSAVPCASVLRHTDDRRAFAEALLVTWIDEAHRDENFDEARWRGRMAALAWLDPHVRWPADDAGLRLLWPERPAVAAAPGGVIVLAGGLSPEVVTRVERAAGQLSQHERLPVARLPLALPGTAPERVATLARAAGVAAVVWAGPDGQPVITAPTAWAGRLEGPGGHTVPVPSAAEATLEALARQVHLARGFEALAHGFVPRAATLLATVEGLEGPIVAWHAAALSLARHLTPVADGQPPPLTLPDDPWVAEVTWLMGQAVRAPGLDPQRKAPELDGRRARLSSAARVVLAPPPGFCAADSRAARLKALERAAIDLERLNLPVLAAKARMARAVMARGEPRQALIEMDHALGLLGVGHAGWLRGPMAQEVMNLANFGPGMGQIPEARALAARAARVALLRLQADTVDDTGPDAPARHRARLAGALTGVASLAPELTRETLTLAVGDRVADRPGLVRRFVEEGAGLTVLMSPEGPARLASVASLLEAVVAPLDPPPKGIDPAEAAVALALTDAVKAAAIGLRGGVPQALALVDAAAARLERHDLPAARARALAEADPRRGGPQGLAHWAPWVGLVVLGGQTTLRALMGQAEPARASAEALAKLAQATLRAEARAAGAGSALDSRINALVVLAYRLAEVLVVGEGPERAQMVKQAERAARAVDLRLADGPARAASRWTVLAGVVLGDLAWWLAQPAGQKPSAASRRRHGGLTAAWVALARDWAAQPEGDASMLKVYGPILAEGLQRLLPDLRAAPPESDLMTRMMQAPRFAQALGGVSRSLASAWSGERIKQGLARGQVEAAVVGQLRSVLTAGVIPTLSQSPERLLALLGDAAARQAEGLGPEAGDLRPLLWFEASVLALAADASAAAVTRARRGPAVTAGTAFAEVPFVWAILVHQALSDSGNRAGAAAALAEAEKACPPLAWHLALARAAHASDTGAAVRRIREAMEGARTADTGHLTATLDLSVREGSSLVEAHLAVPLPSLLLGRPTGTLQISLGASAEAAETERTLTWTLDVDPDGGEVITEAWLLTAWRALASGQQADVGRALGALGAHWAGLTPDQTAPVMQPGPLPLREPVEAVWVGVIAELQGHGALGQWLLVQAFQSTRGGLPDSRAGGRDVCLERFAPAGLPEDGPPLLEPAVCRIPPRLAALIGEPAAEAVQGVVALRLLSTAGAEISPQRWTQALERAHQKAPGLVPAWAAPLKGALETGRANGLPPAQQALVAARGGQPAAPAAKAGYACELAFLASTGRTMKGDPAQWAKACGEGPFAAEALAASVVSAGGLSKGAPRLIEALALAGRMPRMDPQARARLWNLAQRIASADHPSWQGTRATIVGGLAKAARDQQRPDLEVFFRGVKLALALVAGQAPAESPEKVLQAAWRAEAAGASVPIRGWLEHLVYAVPDAASRQKAAGSFLEALKKSR